MISWIYCLQFLQIKFVIGHLLYLPTFDSIVHLLMLIVTETPDCIFHFEDKKSKLTMKLHFGPEKKRSYSGKGFKSKYSYRIYLLKAFL